MNINVSIPLLSAVFYFGLIIIVINSTLTTTKRLFVIYLASQMLWSVLAFIVHGNFFPSSTLLIHEILLFFGFVVPIAFYSFVKSFTGNRSPFLTILSVLLLMAIFILDFAGLIVTKSEVIDYTLIFSVTPIYYLSFFFSFLFLGISVYYLVSKYKGSFDPLERNRIMYVILGLSVNLLFIFSDFFNATSKYPIDQIGNVANAAIVSYAIMKYQLLNIRFVARRGLSYLILILPLACVYAGILFLLQQVFPNQSISVIILAASALAIVMALFSRFLWRYAFELTDRFFYRDTYHQRQKLVNLGNRMSDVNNLSHLASEMLPSICKTLKISETHLLLRDYTSGGFVEQFGYPEIKEEINGLIIDSDSPIISWLQRKNQPLDLRRLNSIPEFKGLWQKELDLIIRTKLGLLSPISYRGELIGILALGQKQHAVCYTQEDIEMLMTLADQAGIIIQNAQSYSQALLRANTDGLTQLYNHRHFHERLEQEISRSSRFGTVFSIILLDIDLFKIYNDNYGHLAGDEVLKRIGEYVRSTIRNIDVAARYGGEEFAIILPETRLADAYIVAERLRKVVETKTSQKAMPVTISVGVASWPEDGVMKEELISRADKALYLAKQNGRNRTQLTSEIGSVHNVKAVSTEANPKALSIIYALAATVDAKDHYTYGHSRKVSEYAVAIAEELGLPLEKLEIIRVSGLLHDIGKIGVPDSVLNKQEPLTEKEWEPIKAHTQLGVDILRHIGDLSDCLPAIIYHHERYDGCGYPSGLKGDTIPLESRILAVADAYEAMTSPRVYRKRLTSAEAIKELKTNSGTQFDPHVVEAFCRVLEKTPAWK